MVCDYNHVFSGEDQPVRWDLGGPPASILVVDEAHNLPWRIMEAIVDPWPVLSCAPLSRERAIGGSGGSHRHPGLPGPPCLRTRAPPIATEELEDELRTRSAWTRRSGPRDIGHYQGRSRRRMEDLAQFLERWSACPDATVRFVDGAKGTFITASSSPG